MGDTNDQVTALLPGITVLAAQPLGGSDRSAVHRLTVSGYERSTIIAKRYLQPGTRWIREHAALSLVGDEVTAPRLIAAADQTVLMTDLGSGRSLADSLLGTDAAVAAADVLRWVEAIAAIHTSTAGQRDGFTEAMNGPQWVEPAPHAEAVRADLAEFAAFAVTLGVAETEAFLAEATAAVDRLDIDAASTHALTPADACPDNNVVTGERLALIDFEGAQWRHIAWDVAYLRVPWPSCWCAWAMPDPVAQAALSRYRQLASPTRPYVASPAFVDDVEVAAVLWGVSSSLWFLSRAMASDATIGDGPRRRAVIQQRLHRAAGYAGLPHVATFAGAMLEATVAAWGRHELALAPAFSG